MKFLVMIPQLIYGGAEKVLVSFANYLVEQGHDVEVLEIYEKGYLKPQFDRKVTFNAICSNEYSSKYYASFLDIKNEKILSQKLLKCLKMIFSKAVGYRTFAEHLSAKYYSDKRFDVAINFLETDTPAFLLNHIQADKFIQWIHIDVSKLRSKEIEEYLPLYKKMDSIICVSKYAQTNFDRKYPQLKDKTTTIYNFYEVDEIIKKAEEFVPKQSSDCLQLLSVGRLVEQKAYLRALEVVDRLISEGHCFRWDIIGDGPEREKIKREIAEKGLQDRVNLLGLKDNPYPYIKNCDLFFLPSLYEGFPTVTIEAKILGKPVLATEVSGIREQIDNKINGVIVENSITGIYKGLKGWLVDSESFKVFSSNSRMEHVLNTEEKYQAFINLCKNGRTKK